MLFRRSIRRSYAIGHRHAFTNRNSDAQSNSRFTKVSGTSLQLQQLEVRCVLSAAPPRVDLSSIAIDPEFYDESTILVRFDVDALAQNGMQSLSLGQELLPGAAIGHSYSLLPGLHKIELTDTWNVTTALAEFAELPYVTYAEPDYRVYSTVTTNDPRFDEMWSLDNQGQTGGTLDADIDALGAWDVNTGSGNVIIAVIDTGVDYNHPDLAANMWTNEDEANGTPGVDDDGNGYVDDVHGYNFLPGSTDPMDDNGHGTHVAGTIGAVGNNSIGVTGINWNIDIMALKFLGADGSGSGSDAIEALEYAVANGAIISNNSWGGDPFSPLMEAAITAASQAGHLFVTAAGNGNIFGIGQDNDAIAFYPSGYEVDNVLSVAATDHNDQLGFFSNYGATSVDLAAPGVEILSTQPGGGYVSNTGTSMATPHVAGVAALVWDANPGWTYTQVIDQILNTVDPIPSLTGLTVTGGRLNAASALGNSEPPPPPPPPATLPHQEDFNDGTAEHFQIRSGNWGISGGRFNVAPAASNDNTPLVAVLPTDAPLPTDLEIQARLNADEGFVEIFGIVFSDFLTNAFVIFDYEDDSNFKFAGADMDNDQWVIGRYDNQVWSIDAAANFPLDASTNYNVNVVIEDETDVSLNFGGAAVVTHDYAVSVVDGAVGLGTRNSSSHFDNLVVQEYVPPLPPAPLPVSDDFEDGAAELFDPQSGDWAIEAGRYVGDALSGGDAVSTWRLQTPLPNDIQIEATMQAVAAGIQQNGFVIFDYQGPTDFKFAGAFVGTSTWSIGHRSASGWVKDQTVGGAIATGTDYQLRVDIQNGDDVTLSVDGVEIMTHSFADDATDGRIGVGARSALTQFDDITVQEYEPPSPPPPVALPINEDFNDGVADLFTVQDGSWTFDAGRYEGTPTSSSDAISVVELTDPLPADVQIDATLQATAAGFQQNGFVIFDYQGPTDFKFAGAFVGTNTWSIGHRDASGWVKDQTVGGTINTATDYDLRVDILNDRDVVLTVDGLEIVTHTFGDDATDGGVGVGVRSAVSEFDNFAVQEFVPPPPPPPVDLPVAEDFEDGAADLFTVQSGAWSIEAGRYEGSPTSGSDAVSVVELTGPLPADLQIEATLQAVPVGIQQNGFVIFDYQNPTDFKFAGAFVGTNTWSIGHRNASGWVKDVTVGGTIDTSNDYDLRVDILGNSDIVLRVDGVEMVTHTFADDATDGSIGVGVRSAVSQFDDVLIQEFVPPPPPPSVTLPVVEDFNDGEADLFAALQGSWQIDAGQYVGSPTSGSDAVSVIEFTDPLPTDLQIDTTLEAVPGGIQQNGFVIFDYQGPTDFKFAGAFVGTNTWAIGHRNAGGWIKDQLVGSSIDAGVEYGLQVSIENSHDVVLTIDGVDLVSYTFADDATDGAIGVGVRSAVSKFDDFAVQDLTGAGALALSLGLQQPAPTEMGTEPTNAANLVDLLFGEETNGFLPGREADLAEGVGPFLDNGPAIREPSTAIDQNKFDTKPIRKLEAKAVLFSVTLNSADGKVPESVGSLEDWLAH